MRVATAAQAAHAQAAAPFRANEIETQLGGQDPTVTVTVEALVNSDGDYPRLWSLQFADVQLEKEFSRSMPKNNLANRTQRIKCALALFCFGAIGFAGALLTIHGTAVRADASLAAKGMQIPNGIVLALVAIVGTCLWLKIVCGETNSSDFTKTFQPFCFGFFTLYMIASKMVWYHRFQLAGDGPMVFPGAVNQFNPIALASCLGSACNCTGATLLYLFMFRPLFRWALWYVLNNAVAVLIFAGFLTDYYRDGSAYAVLLLLAMYILGLAFALQSVHSSESLQRDIFVHAHSLRNAMDLEADAQQAIQMAEQSEQIKHTQLRDVAEEELISQNADLVELVVALGGSRMQSVVDCASLCESTKHAVLSKAILLASAPKPEAIVCIVEDGLKLMGDIVVWRYALYYLLSYASRTAGSAGVVQLTISPDLASSTSDDASAALVKIDFSTMCPSDADAAYGDNSIAETSTDLSIARHLVGLMGSSIMLTGVSLSFSVDGVVTSCDAPPAVHTEDKRVARKRTKPRYTPRTRTAPVSPPAGNALVMARSNTLLGDILGSDGNSRTLCGGSNSNKTTLQSGW
jgi:hypothetical protein